MHPILQHLKKHGELMDFQIAKDLGTTLQAAKEKLAELAATNEVIMCYVMRFEGKQKTLALGVFPEVSLAEARDLREEARALLKKTKVEVTYFFYMTLILFLENFQILIHY